MIQCLRRHLMHSILANVIITATELVQVTSADLELYALSDASVMQQCPADSSLELLTRLDFCGHKLKRTSGLPDLPQLKHLCLAFNELLALPGLEVVPALTHLDISHNSLSTLDGIQPLSALLHLTACFNVIAETDALNDLRRCNSHLTCLDLDMNPVTAAKSYIALAIRRLPKLVVLDGTNVTSLDRHCANTTGVAITPDLLRSGCTDMVTKQSVSDVSSATGLCLDNCRLRRLGCITALTQLSWASFDSNELVSLTEMQALGQLNTLICSVRLQVSNRLHLCCLTAVVPVLGYFMSTLLKTMSNCRTTS
jgi:Leucine-rich repeat (LRR) protein